MPAPVGADAKRPKDRRDRILDVAAELIADRGFAAVSMQDIGEGTGITGGAIYRHFPSKHTVLQTLLEETIAMWLARARSVRAACVAAGTPVLGPLIEDALTTVADHRGRVATYVRERHRVAPAARMSVVRNELDLDVCWREAILERQPGLDRSDLAARQQAVVGVLGALSRKPAVLAASRVGELVAEGLESMAASAPVAAAPTEPRAAVWDGPVLRRQQIISTAMTLFSERGFHGVGLNEVGEALGIAGPSIYEYFEGKIDILLDAFDQSGAFVIAGAMTAVRQASSAADALDRLIASFVAICSEYVELIVVTSREGGSLPVAERPRLTRRRRDLHETWSAVLREVRPAVSPIEARALVRCSFALIQQVCRVSPERRLAPARITALVRPFIAPYPRE